MDNLFQLLQKIVHFQVSVVLRRKFSKLDKNFYPVLFLDTLITDTRFVNIRKPRTKQSVSFARKLFLFKKNDDATNKRFTNRVTRCVRKKSGSYFLASSGGTKKIGLRISQYGPSNPVSKLLLLYTSFSIILSEALSSDID